jgi:hypothetical protein
MKKNLLRAPVAQLLGLTACLLAFDGHGQNPSTSIERVKNAYAFTNWVGKTQAIYKQPVRNWKPDFGPTSFTNVTEKVRGNARKIYVVGEEASGSLTVRVTECDGVLAAHETLIEMLSNCSAPQPLPEGQPAGFDLGDKCFVGYPTNAPLQVFFARNNMVLWISTGQTNINVPRIAKELDAQIRKQSGP